MRKEVIFSNDKWVIFLDVDKQLSFSYFVPAEKSEYKKDPFGFTFDEHDSANEEELSYTMTGMSKSPFAFKTVLLNEIVTMIKVSKTNFFYFKPTTRQRGKIYTNLTNLLIKKLGNWSFQDIDSRYFYFTKNE